jgi:putative phosphoribosyl transferase
MSKSLAESDPAEGSREVIERELRRQGESQARGALGAVVRQEHVVVGAHGREGILDIPANSAGLVIFAHGSGSGRFSPRNNFVARELQRAGLGTLLIDLLTPEEEQNRANVFDINLLASRLDVSTQWAREDERTRALRIGYFGASTGAGAAMVAAADANSDIAAIVSRGGRPDLAGNAIHHVRAPTLLIVGGFDAPVIALNEHVYEALSAEKDLRIVAGAGHVFEEPGTLEEVARLASGWFTKYLGAPGAEAGGGRPDVY